jgi:hypothetical protein
MVSLARANIRVINKILHRPQTMTTLNRNNIPSAITTLEGLMAWAMLTYTAANGHVSYSETTTLDVQAMASYGISPVKSEINGSSLFLVGRFAVPLNNDLLANGTVAWLGTIENDNAVVLPAGYKV